MEDFRKKKNTVGKILKKRTNCPLRKGKKSSTAPLRNVRERFYIK
jgi:hypothetical protein